MGRTGWTVAAVMLGIVAGWLTLSALTTFWRSPVIVTVLLVGSAAFLWVASFWAWDKRPTAYMGRETDADRLRNEHVRQGHSTPVPDCLMCPESEPSVGAMVADYYRKDRR